MRDLSEALDLVSKRLRGIICSLGGRIRFRKVGRNFSLYGRSYFYGSDISVGDNCWFQAVDNYKGNRYSPTVAIGNRCMFSNNVHISAVEGISIGRDCLFGSNIYVGDHSHGSTRAECLDINIPPADRPLSDIGAISIGERVWVCDGVVILAGSHIADGCIIGANSVVKGYFPKSAIIAGAPARIIKELS